MKIRNKFIGIIVLITVIALGMIACGDLPVDENRLYGSLVIMKTVNGSLKAVGKTEYIGELLTGSWVGDNSSEVVFHWMKDGVDIATGKTYTPTTEGAYTAKVTFESKESKPSSVVNIIQIPVNAIPADLFGYWVFTGGTGNFKVGTTTFPTKFGMTEGTAIDEEINFEHFGNNWVFQLSNNYITSRDEDGINMYEFLAFDVTGFEELTSGIISGYQYAYKLSVTNAVDQGYGNGAYNNVESIIIYLDDAKMKIKRTNQSGATVDREYIKHTGSIFECECHAKPWYQLGDEIGK